jgi:hypothetical protein
MEENLVGYLLDALDADERREVERRMREQPEARSRLDVLRRALEPLALDRDTIEPPADLWERTVARAEALGRPRPALRVVGTAAAPGRTWWRRADVLVAASLLLCVSLLVPPGISYLHYRADIATCQNNLRQFYAALKGYGDAHGQLPDVTAVKAPANIAGLVVPVLLEEMRGGTGADYRELSVTCPGNGDAPPLRIPRGLTLRDLQHMDRQEFERYAAEMLGSYAYSLGYREADSSYRVHRFGPELPPVPIMSDRPPLPVFAGNSPNHWGKGQNVLYGDGHCTFVTSRRVGANLDDIYLNANGEVAAGRYPADAVLGESRAQP